MPIRRAAASFNSALYRTPFWSEILSGTAAMGWGVWSFVGTGDLISRPGFSQLGFFAQSLFWELTGLALGLLQVVVALKWNNDTRWWVAAFSSAWWLFLALSVYRWDSHAPTIWLLMNAAIGNMISMLRLGGGVPASWLRPR